MPFLGLSVVLGGVDAVATAGALGVPSVMNSACGGCWCGGCWGGGCWGGGCWASGIRCCLVPLMLLSLLACVSVHLYRMACVWLLDNGGWLVSGALVALGIFCHVLQVTSRGLVH